ncbi:hypothetical protein KI387_036672, partial [Taxus chinensis]
MKERNNFSWNATISAYRRHGFPCKEVTLFSLYATNMAPINQFTSTSIPLAYAKMDLGKRNGN